MRASDADRERVAQILHTAMGEGRITMEELEERLTTVYAAKTLGDLRPVTADLPIAQQAAAAASTAIQPAPSHAVTSPAGVDQRIGGRPGSMSSIGILSGAERKGRWVLPQQHNTVAFWGGTEIDLRQASFAEQHSTITAMAIMGGVQITVPDDIIVEVTGIGFMGAFQLDDRSGAPDAPPSAPVVKITGLALMGGVVVIRRPRQPDRGRLEN
jgi:hypothetical protein